jgi:MraZ protein
MSDLGTVPSANAGSTPSDRATFYGVAYHKVSGRNQVAIPKHMKRAMDEAQEGQLLLMRWQAEPFLRLYTKKQFDKKLDEVKEKPNLSNEQKAGAVALIARAAEPVEPDSQGRFVLPGKWADALNIREEVAFCGSFTYIEIWPAERHREVEKAEQEKLAPVSQEVTSILNM